MLTDLLVFSDMSLDAMTAQVLQLGAPCGVTRGLLVSSESVA